MICLEWLMQLDWLLGVVVGAVLGFVFGFVSTEVKTLRERKRRKTDLAASLASEISVNRQICVEGITTVEEGRRPVAPPFGRTVFAGCATDLALLPKTTRLLAIGFYGSLDTLESVVKEWYFQEGKPRSESAGIYYMATWSNLQDQFLAAGRLAVEKADAALRELDNIAGPRQT